MTEWTPGAVRAAAAEWVWVPPTAEQVLTSDYQLIAYPPHFQQPTQVAWSASDRPAADLIDEVLDRVRSLGRETVYWWVRDTTRPADTEDALQARGATLAEIVHVLAYDLSGGEPELSLANGPRAEVISDEAGVRATYLIDAEVWDEHKERTAGEIAAAVAEVRGELASWSSFRVLVFLDGEPAAAGGCTLVGPVARLWGAGTLPQFRGRGAYRTLLATRISLARQHGATLALVKGRVQTSGPILRRAGFTAYSEERCYQLSST